MKAKNLNLQPMALLAELVGTFIFVTVALVTQGNPLFLGFSLIALVLALGSISGAHVNPAVTFGLWSVKKLEAIKLPFYWVMQIAGALLAFLLLQWFKGSSLGLTFSFGHFDARVVIAELIGTAVFTFGIAAAVQRELSDGAKAACIGLALLTGLAVGGGLLGSAAQSTDLTKNGATPRAAQLDGVTINPAVALVATEKDDQQSSLQSAMGQSQAAPAKKAASRFTWETLVGTLVGGALGMNLFMLTAGVNPMAKEQTVKDKLVTKVFKKGKK